MPNKFGNLEMIQTRILYFRKYYMKIEKHSQEERKLKNKNKTQCRPALKHLFLLFHLHVDKSSKSNQTFLCQAVTIGVLQFTAQNNINNFQAN